MLLRSQNIHFDGLRLEDVVFIDEDTDAQMASTRVQPDDVLLNITGASLGRCTIAPKDIAPANVNQHVCILRPSKKRVDSRFLNMEIQSAPVQRAIFAGENGSSREGLTSEQVGNLEIVLPPLPDQQAIADYLDRETARLDGLVAAKECVLGLLAEKRRALITRAVTRGLVPTVPFRDSSIPWLGEIPAHWEAKRLKFTSPEITVGIVVTPAKYYESAGVPCLRSLNVREEGLTDSDLVYINDESNALLAKSRVFLGDLVAVRSGQPGTTAVVDERFNGANCIDLIIIRRPSTFVSAFLSHFLNSQPAKMQFLSGSGGAIQQHFNTETAKDLVTPVPPLEEQRVIVAYIEKETAKLDALREATERTIGLLKERRAALIAAAVTGRIAIPENTEDNLPGGRHEN